MENYSSKKIAFIATVYRHLEAFHIPFIQYLIQEGYEIHCYASTDEGLNEVKNAGAICHHIPLSRNPLHLNNFKSIRLLTKYLRRDKISMVHVHTPVAALVGRIASRMSGVSVVMYTAHGFHFFSGAPIINWAIYYPLERILARFTDYLITINLEDYKRAQHFKVRRKVLYVPGVGITKKTCILKNSEEARQNVRRELGIDYDGFVILYIAEINANKNQVQMLNAMKLLHDSGQNKIYCLFAGQGDINLLVQIKKSNNLDNVRFLGFRRDIDRLILGSDIIALLSKREGLPKSLMEAMYYGKPILATNVRGSRDLVSHGVNGYLVTLDDVIATRNAIFSMSQDPARTAQMSIESREMVKKYGLNRILDQMKQIYQEALSTITF